MKIKKQLKHARFTWNEDSKTFSIEQPTGNKIELDKVYSFALMRFIIRIAQRNFLKKPQANKSKLIENAEDAEFEEIDQQSFNF
jgi:hypothetical protein